jgi:hypothetical protein
MSAMRIVLLIEKDQLQFIEMPASHAYQLTALHHRLHKEISKLTAEQVPTLPRAIAEFDQVEFTSEEHHLTSGLDYINSLEQSFARTKETTYPLISLLTEIRALQAQLEQWYEEENE